MHTEVKGQICRNHIKDQYGLYFKDHNVKYIIIWFDAMFNWIFL